jgi:death-on-curing family protein
MQTNTLSVDDVLFIHQTLVRDFAEDGDPIEPPGVKSMALLESAVGRQYTAIGPIFKYPNPIENAATLMYGVCCDHPFHNGNKRTALVSMIAHLDRNNLVLDVRKIELYKLVMEVATHRARDSSDRRKRKKKIQRPSPDEEVNYIANFIKRYVRDIRRGERVTTYKELRRILGKFNITLEEPKKNQIKIVRHIKEVTGFFRKKEVVRQINIGSITYSGDNREVTIGSIKLIRKMCGLSEQNGIDSSVFYDSQSDSQSIIDSFINQYRTILRKLSHR